ncbi:hypothetical protein Patl1_04669 [Pistacia atlantica]|uniref:Uncharacterized protein n=1 Tax=Pistacia atlantica TaxID=434234 RepID=A0ACC1BUG7_9ROSI|nr:hypothetical protein Patl1_04669 [Pistacia atlantica]
MAAPNLNPKLENAYSLATHMESKDTSSLTLPPIRFSFPVMWYSTNTSFLSNKRKPICLLSPLTTSIKHLLFTQILVKSLPGRSCPFPYLYRQQSHYQPHQQHSLANPISVNQNSNRLGISQGFSLQCIVSIDVELQVGSHWISISHRFA